jgi:hypothetical protein
MWELVETPSERLYQLCIFTVCLHWSEYTASYTPSTSKQYLTSHLTVLSHHFELSCCAGGKSPQMFVISLRNRTNVSGGTAQVPAQRTIRYWLDVLSFRLRLVMYIEALKHTCDPFQQLSLFTCFNLPSVPSTTFISATLVFSPWNKIVIPSKVCFVVGTRLASFSNSAHTGPLVSTQRK